MGKLLIVGWELGEESIKSRTMDHFNYYLYYQKREKEREKLLITLSNIVKNHRNLLL